MVVTAPYIEEFPYEGDGINIQMAGIPRNQWNSVNRTGNEMYEQMLTEQLSRNKLDSSGTPTVRPSGQK